MDRTHPDVTMAGAGPDRALLMLQELRIRDFAIIDELNLVLEPGLNVLTGETGAGKSILVDAVAMLLGGRIPPQAIRAGASRAVVEGLFTLSAEQQELLAPLLEREGLDSDDPASLWLTREVRSPGRSVARVNGVVVTTALLREIAETLVDIHGQSEHLSLLRVREHLDLLDRYGELGALRQDLAGLVGQIQALRNELKALRQGERERIQRIDLLRFQVEEITAAALQPDEESTLEAERVRLANAEQLAATLNTLLALLEEGAERTPAVLDLLGRAQREMHTLVRIDASLTPQSETLETLAYQLEDIVRDLRAYLAHIEYNPRRLQQVEERLSLIHHLRRKYGGTIEDILAYARRAAEDLNRLEHSDERIAELEQEEARWLEQAARLVQTLHEQRLLLARRLAEQVERELHDLRMQGTRFAVAFRLQSDTQGLLLEHPLPEELWVTSEGLRVQRDGLVTQAAFDRRGIDQIEFLLEPNPGEGLRPLAQIASGGETARLMLALKAVLARADRTSTLIFDEIDQGIGGRVGAIVGQKLWLLASPATDVQHQVLCITHLPQLAGFGDAHYRIQKQVTDGRTHVRVERLDEAARLQELGAMLGTQGEAAEQGARDILDRAERFKRHVLTQTGALSN